MYLLFAEVVKSSMTPPEAFSLTAIPAVVFGLLIAPDKVSCRESVKAVGVPGAEDPTVKVHTLLTGPVRAKAPALLCDEIAKVDPAEVPMTFPIIVPGDEATTNAFAARVSVCNVTVSLTDIPTVEFGVLDAPESVS